MSGAPRGLDGNRGWFRGVPTGVWAKVRRTWMNGGRQGLLISAAQRGVTKMSRRGAEDELDCRSGIAAWPGLR